MDIGIFAKTYKKASLSEILDAVVRDNYQTVQFNMACVGLPSMPNSLPESLPGQIATEFQLKGLRMSALSGTFNMIHPDPVVRNEGLKSLELLIKNAQRIGTNNITLCTGSADPTDMWRFHSNNNSKKAWLILCKTMETALEMAEIENVNLLIEPELANVVNSPLKAKRLIHEMRSNNLKIVFDPANLFEVATPSEIEEVIEEGINLLADHIEIAHAKDRSTDGKFTAAGLGILPYSFFLKKLMSIGFDGDLITHGLSENDAKGCFEFLNGHMNKWK